jgi:hypothetical protein
MRRSAVVAPLLVPFVLTAGWAQSPDLELDEGSAVERQVREEELSRLREDPLDLRKASLEDLLIIPGLRRREAQIILAAVREGRLVELRGVDLLHGVSSGTAELLAPYVVIGSAGGERWVTKIRSFTRFGWDDGPVELGRETIDLMLDEAGERSDRRTARVELRRSVFPSARQFIFFRVPAIGRRIILTLGDITTRAGSSIFDPGRRASVYRPSEWSRRLTAPARISPGYDAESSSRGMAVHWAEPDHAILLGYSRDRAGQAQLVSSWAATVVEGLSAWGTARSHPARSSFSLNQETGSGMAGLEVAFGFGRTSIVAWREWEDQGASEWQWLFRSLRDVDAAGVPHLGGAGGYEDAVAMAWRLRISNSLRTRIVGDVGRSAMPGIPARAPWDRRMATMLGLEWRGRSSWIDLEVLASSVAGGKTGGWTMIIGNRISSSLDLRVTMSIRRRTDEGFTDGVGRCGMVEVGWKSETMTLRLRGTATDGSSNVAFWTAGPGPTVLSGLHRSAGRQWRMQSVLTWNVLGRLDFGWSVEFQRSAVRESSSSILFEFHL